MYNGGHNGVRVRARASLVALDAIVCKAVNFWAPIELAAVARVPAFHKYTHSARTWHAE